MLNASITAIPSVSMFQWRAQKRRHGWLPERAAEPFCGTRCERLGGARAENSRRFCGDLQG